MKIAQHILPDVLDRVQLIREERRFWRRKTAPPASIGGETVVELGVSSFQALAKSDHGSPVAMFFEAIALS